MKRKLLIAGIAACGIVFGFFVWRLGGPELGLVGIVTGFCGWLLGRHKAKPTRDAAQARLDDAVELGQLSIAEAERKAQHEVDDGMDEHPTLGSYLNDRTGNDGS